MKCISNTLVISADIWEDPGDYPNSLAGGPLPSHSYIESSGELVLEAENNEELESFDALNDWFSDWIHCGAEASKIGAYVDIPSYWHIDWEFKVDGNIVTVTVGDDSEANEPDDD